MVVKNDILNVPNDLAVKTAVPNELAVKTAVPNDLAVKNGLWDLFDQPIAPRNPTPQSLGNAIGNCMKKRHLRNDIFK